MAHATKTIPIGELRLDTTNPRHEQASSQREAIQALIATERQKLVVLASDIKEHGLSPIDRLLVVKEGRAYTVVEGNRRLTAVKLLENPSLADHTAIEAQIKRVARDAVVPDTADCAVVASRDEAAHWMVLRHRGEADGAGVVRWNTFASNRFSHKPGSQAAKAIDFLEAIEAGYPDNETIASLSNRIAEKRLTTLGRLVSDPNFKSRIGMIDDNGAIQFHFPATALEDFVAHVLGDIASDVTVSQLKSKDLRAKYLKSTPTPDPSTRTPEPQPLTDIPTGTGSKKPKPKPRPAKPPKPFKELNLDQLGTKIQALMKEFRSLDTDKMANTTGVMIRVILDLSVDEFIAKAKLKPQSEQLRKRVEVCLARVDPTHKDPQYHGLRAGLKDGSSLYAMKSLHAFVHNRHYHADGATVRSIAANVEPFLQAMNDLA